MTKITETGITETADALAADFALFSDWEERYGYVLDLGRALPTLPETLRTEANRVRGCASQVWLVSDLTDGRLQFRGDSDAHIVRGLVALALKLFSDRTPAEILAADPQAIFQRLGVGEALTAQRANGMASLLKRIQADARAAL
jgi:cysteine desulfuration protein SufE